MSPMAMRSAAAVAFCVVFVLPFWNAATRPAEIDYSRCGAMKEDLERLTCFDAAFQRAAAAAVSRMTFGEILAGSRHGDDGDEWASPY